LPELICRVEPVGNQSTLFGIKSEWIDRGQPIASCQRDDEIAIREVNNVRRDDQAAMRFARECRNDAFNFAAALRLEAN
jgi:hypothetical protein